LFVNLLSLIPASEAVPAVSTNSSANVAQDFSALLLQLVGSNWQPVAPADQTAPVGNLIAPRPTETAAPDIPVPVEPREKTEKARPKSELETPDTPSAVPVSIEPLIPAAAPEKAMATVSPVSDIAAVESPAEVTPDLILQDVRKITISVHHEALSAPELPSAPEVPVAKPVIATDAIANTSLQQLPPRIELKQTPKPVIAQEPVQAPLPTEQAPAKAETKIAAKEPMPAPAQEPMRDSVQEPKHGAMPVIPMPIIPVKPISSEPLEVKPVPTTDVASKEVVTNEVAVKEAATKDSPTPDRPKLMVIPRAIVTTDPIADIRSQQTPLRIEPARQVVPQPQATPTDMGDTVKPEAVAAVADVVVNDRPQQSVGRAPLTRQSSVDESTDDPVGTPIITSDPIAARHVLQAQPRLTPVQRIPTEAKPAEHRGEPETTDTKETTVSMPTPQESPTLRSEVAADQPRAAQHVEMPQLPKLQVIRTIAVEVGDADSQVLVRIESRGHGMNLEFGAGSETLRERLESSVGSLVDALKDQKINTTNVQVSRRAPIEKVRRMKEAH